jgi:putative ABC transport system permease protein
VNWDAVAARLHRQDPSGDMGFGVYLQTLNNAFTGNVRPALLMLMGCVGFVLLIACANVANLLLARGAVRQREMAVRTALGASPLRIIRQLLTESVLLAGAGGAIGIAIAFLLLHGILAIHPPAVPRIEQTGIDGAVLAYLLLVSVLVGILFGLAPAMKATRVDVNDSLREHGSSTSHGFGRHRSVLVIGETALACMLLVGTGLALRSLWSLRSVKLGFAPEHVLTFRIAAPWQLTGSRIPDFYHDVVERVRALPGVESAAVARDFPLSGTDPSTPIDTEGKTPGPAKGRNRHPIPGCRQVRTLGISVLQGRTFDERDTVSSPPVAIVSESLASKYWPGESAVRKRIKPRIAGSSWCIVAGVVADVRHWGANAVIEPTAYYPYTQVPDSIRSLVEANMGIAVRSRLVENRIKEQQLGLFADRTSTAKMRSNQLRLYFSSIAYCLLEALRRLGLKDSEMAQAQCSTIRLRLLKIGAQIRLSVRRICIAMAAGHPGAPVFEHAWRNLQAIPLPATA